NTNVEGRRQGFLHSKTHTAHIVPRTNVTTAEPKEWHQGLLLVLTVNGVLHNFRHPHQHVRGPSHHINRNSVIRKVHTRPDRPLIVDLVAKGRGQIGQTLHGHSLGQVTGRVFKATVITRKLDWKSVG